MDKKSLHHRFFILNGKFLVKKKSSPWFRVEMGERACYTGTHVYMVEKLIIKAGLTPLLLKQGFIFYVNQISEGDILLFSSEKI